MLWGGAPPRDPGAPAPVLVEGACRLGVRGEAPGCPCDALEPRARLALGLPVTLDALGASDLELLDGVGPARAAAIAAERERGAFGSSDSLADRVAGIGPATAARIAAQLAGQSGASCEPLSGS